MYTILEVKANTTHTLKHKLDLGFSRFQISKFISMPQLRGKTRGTQKSAQKGS